MTAKELAYLVTKYRDAERTHVQTGAPSDHTKVRRLAERLDRCVEIILEPAKRPPDLPGQQRMFA
jgi:hypothetical protein